MRTVDFTPLYRSIVGFDRLADMMDSATKIESQGYPPYNIQHVADDEYQIELAVAGFGEEDLTVEVQENVLTVSGRIAEKTDADERRFVHRGIAERAFERRFQLADHVRPVAARTENGLLHVDLVREVPEALRDSLDLAFCDLARWMAGWGTWGNDLSARVGGVLDRLDGGRDLGSEEAYDAAVRRVFPLARSQFRPSRCEMRLLLPIIHLPELLRQ